MKSIIKRILLYFLVLMLLGLASCGGAEQLPQPQSPTDAPSHVETVVLMSRVIMIPEIKTDKTAKIS